MRRQIWIASIISVALFLVLMSFPLVSAGTVTFYKSSATISSVMDGSLGTSFQIALSASNIPAGSTVLLRVWWRDCTTNTNMGVTVTDDGGNAYTQIASQDFAGCGTVDDINRMYRSNAGVNQATAITITQTNPPAAQVYVFAAVMLVYTGVSSFGSPQVSSGSSAFPFLDVPRTVAGSWMGAGMKWLGADENASSMNAGLDRVQIGEICCAGGGSLLGFDNSVTGGSSGGGHSCGTNLCVLPNMPASRVWFLAGIELQPSLTPAVTTLPATGVSNDRALLNGNLTDLGSGPTVRVWFDWGDNSSQLGNRTPNQTFSITTTFSAQLYSLFTNHTYFFRAHAENTGNASLNATGIVLQFSTGDPLKDIKNVFLPFIFFALMFTMMYLAWTIRRRHAR